MTDLFRGKAADWDQRPVPAQISEGVSRAMLAAVPFSPDDAVMDFGAGTGLLAGKIAPRVRSVLAVDVSPAMLEQLAKKPELQGKVEVFCQDLTAAPLGRTVDRVVSAMAMHHVEDTAALLRALYAHLRPGGTVALADLDREDGDFHPPGTEGVFHAGFDRESLVEKMRDAGFVDARVVTACEVDKGEKRYPVFLATATRPRD